MNSLWKDFVVTMEQTVELCQGLLQLGENKKEALKSRNVAELAVITKQEEYLVLQLGKIGRQRKNIVKEIGDRTCQPPETFTMEKLLQAMDDETAQRFSMARTALEKVSKDLAKLNNLNQKLITQNLAYVEISLNLIAESRATGPVYAPQGRTSSVPRHKTFFDQKA